MPVTTRVWRWSLAELDTSDTNRMGFAIMRWLRLPGIVSVVCVLGITSLSAEPIYKEHRYQFEDYYEWYLPFKKSLSTLNDEKVQQTYQSLVSIRPDSFFLGYANYELAEYYLKAGQMDEARKKASSLLTHSPIIKEKALTLLVREALARKDKKETLMWYGQLISQCADADLNNQLWSDVQESYAEPFTLNDSLLTFDDKRGYLRNLVRKEYYIRAKELGIALLPQCDTPKIRAEIEFLIGFCHYKLLDTPTAITYLKSALKHDKRASFYNDAVFYLGRAYEESGYIQKAEEMYVLNLKQKKANPERARTYFYLTQLYRTYGPFAKQQELEANFTKEFPLDLYTQRYKWLTAWDEAFPKVLENTQFESFYTKTFKQESLADTMKRYPLSYDIYKIVSLKSQALDSPKNLSIERYKTLKQKGLGAMAIDEIRYRNLQRSVPSVDDGEAWLYIYLDQSNFYDATEEAKRVIQTAEENRLPLTPLMITALYPKAYPDSVQKYAKKYGIEPELLWAIMREESQFFPKYISLSKKIGLCPLSSDVAKEICWRLGETWGSTANIKDPDTNIRYAAFYLADLSKQFNGNMHLTVLAFHHSPLIAGKVSQQTQSTFLNPIINATPYADAKDILRRVNDSYLAYKLLYR